MKAKTQLETSCASDALATATRPHSTAVHLLRAVRSKDRASGIGPAQLSALSVLVFGGEKSMRELAEAEQVRPTTMTRIAAGLERAGLARREQGQDKRSIRLTATSKGVKLLRQAQKRRVEMLASALAELGQQNIRKVAEATELVHSALAFVALFWEHNKDADPCRILGS
ncbi:MAG TPA: MarR family transcriptional regulator [Candidatus Acidoferrales bacterium]